MRDRLWQHLEESEYQRRVRVLLSTDPLQPVLSVLDLADGDIPSPVVTRTVAQAIRLQVVESITCRIAALIEQVAFADGGAVNDCMRAAVAAEAEVTDLIAFGMDEKLIREPLDAHDLLTETALRLSGMSTESLDSADGLAQLTAYVRGDRSSPLLQRAQAYIEQGGYAASFAAGSYCTPSELLMTAIDRLAADQSTSGDIAGNLATPTGFLTSWAESERVWVRMKVAGNPMTPSEVLQRMSQGALFPTEWLIRDDQFPAEEDDEDFDPEAQEELDEQSRTEWEVVLSLAANPSNTSAGLAAILGQWTAFIEDLDQGIDPEPSLPLRLLSYLVNSRSLNAVDLLSVPTCYSDEVAAVAALNPHTPVTVLAHLANRPYATRPSTYDTGNSQREVCLAIACNPMATREVLMELSSIDDALIQGIVRMRI